MMLLSASAASFKQTKTLAFASHMTEMEYQQWMSERHVGTFRSGYALGLVLLFLKMTLLAIAAASLDPISGGNQNAGETRGVMELIRSTQAALTQGDLVGEVVTVLGCCVALFAALGFSFLRTWFLQFHHYVNQLLFLIVGLVCVTLPNVVDGSIKSFSVIAEVYILFFPFCLLLRLSFPRSVVAGWTIVILFFVLRLVAKTGVTTVDPIELTTVAIYLVLGVLAMNVMTYSLERAERCLFQAECRDHVESPTTESMPIADIPLVNPRREEV